MSLPEYKRGPENARRELKRLDELIATWKDDRDQALLTVKGRSEDIAWGLEHRKLLLAELVPSGSLHSRSNRPRRTLMDDEAFAAAQNAALAAGLRLVVEGRSGPSARETEIEHRRPWSEAVARRDAEFAAPLVKLIGDVLSEPHRLVVDSKSGLRIACPGGDCTSGYVACGDCNGRTEDDYEDQPPASRWGGLDEWFYEARCIACKGTGMWRGEWTCWISSQFGFHSPDDIIEPEVPQVEGIYRIKLNRVGYEEGQSVEVLDLAKCADCGREFPWPSLLLKARNADLVTEPVCPDCQDERNG